VPGVAAAESSSVVVLAASSCSTLGLACTSPGGGTTTDDDSAAATPGTSSATRLSSAFEVLRNQLEGSESEVAEVFGPPAPTRASISNEQVATTEVEQGTPSLPELTSFSPAAGGLAVLDGRVVRVGGQVGDFVLRAVTPQGVVLQLDDRTFELTLE
ncbi:MAG: hypothetical protein AAF747_00860, partial [Planctomycetota bacterium]